MMYLYDTPLCCWGQTGEWAVVYAANCLVRLSGPARHQLAPNEWMNTCKAVERMLGIWVLRRYPLRSSETWLVRSSIYWQINEVASPGCMRKCISYRKNARSAEDVLPSGDGRSRLFPLTSREEVGHTEKLSGVGAEFLKHWGSE